VHLELVSGTILLGSLDCGVLAQGIWCLQSALSAMTAGNSPHHSITCSTNKHQIPTEFSQYTPRSFCLLCCMPALCCAGYLVTGLAVIVRNRKTVGPIGRVQCVLLIATGLLNLVFKVGYGQT
jgi:hypothetical protein